MLENDDPRNGNAVFWTSSGIQNRAKTGAGQLIFAVLWMAGCGQRDMGAVECEMAVPGREEGQTTANDPAAA